MVDAVPETLAEDRLEGVRAISEFIGEPYRRTLYMIEAGQIPVGRLSKRRIVASKAVLREHWFRLTGAKSAADPSGGE